MLREINKNIKHEEREREKKVKIKKKKKKIERKDGWEREKAI